MESSGDKNVPKETNTIPSEVETEQGYFCFDCSKSFNVHSQHEFNYICIYCGGEFLEEIDQEDDPRNFTPFDNNTNLQNNQGNSNIVQSNNTNIPNNNPLTQNNNIPNQNNNPNPIQTIANMILGNVQNTNNVNGGPMMQQTTSNNTIANPQNPFGLQGATIITGGNTNVQIIHTSYNVGGNQSLSINSNIGNF